LPDGIPGPEVGVHQHVVNHVAFSPDGKSVASDQYGLVRIWRVVHNGVSRQIPTDGISLAILSRDGTLFAPAGYMQRGGVVTRTRVLETSTGNTVGLEIVPGGIIMDAAIDPDKNWLALSVSTTPDRVNASLGSRVGSGNIQFWDYRSGQKIGKPIPMPSEPRGLAVHPSGKWIGVCCQAGEGIEIEVATRLPKTLFKLPSLLRRRFRRGDNGQRGRVDVEFH
jgi:WD40 repeat protein